jgi:hypothetical protein
MSKVISAGGARDISPGSACNFPNFRAPLRGQLPGDLWIASTRRLLRRVAPRDPGRLGRLGLTTLLELEVARAQPWSLGWTAGS